MEVGEEPGDLDTMLYKIADFYDEWVDNLVKSLISLLEPLMIVFRGYDWCNRDLAVPAAD